MQKRVSILGSRGIPNRYGGFEQCAEFLSESLSDAGLEVTVSNPADHEFKEKKYKNVNIERVFCPEGMIGSAAHILYDFISLIKCVLKHQDVIIMLGYQSSVFGLMAVKPFLRKTKIIVNMDGLEWKRSKWSNFVRKFTKWAEKKVIGLGLIYVSDNRGLVKYFLDSYGVSTHYIPYGTANIDAHKLGDKDLPFSIPTKNYAIVVARIEPENNVDMILDGISSSRFEGSTIIIGEFAGNKHAQFLINKYSSDRIIFAGGIYEQRILDHLRYNSSLYFHGHSVGGTNPSLVEAMQLSCRIFAYDNIFNRETTKDNAIFFTTARDLRNKINRQIDINFQDMEKNISRYSQIIRDDFNWEKVAERYLALCND